MSYLVDDYHGDTVAAAPVNERVAFIRRTYAHVFGAVLAFAGLSTALVTSGLGEQILRDLFTNRFAWPALMVVFIVGSIGAQYMAQSNKSVGIKYAGLTLYVLLYTILFVPILTVATNPQFGIANPNNPGSLPLQAGIVTLLAFAGLTVAVFVSKKDFSFMGPILCVCSFLALGVIVAAMIGGFSLGLAFTALMVALFAGYIIYDTSNIIHKYHTNEHVAASMALFGSFAMLFYYILMLFMQTRDD
jgi:FtsH-binding integral membrane protein